MKKYQLEISQEELDEFENSLKSNELTKDLEISKTELIILYKLLRVEKMLGNLNDKV